MREGDSFFGGHTRPWYRRRSSDALVVAVGLFVGVSILQWFNDDAAQAIAVLYVLPVALLAVTFGLRGGLVAATFGFVLFALFEIFHSSGEIDVDGWLVRAIAMFLLGALLGRATDQSTASERTAVAEQHRRDQLEEVNRRYREALEINDSILQQIVAAKWKIERGQPEEAAEVLAATIERGERMVQGLLPKRVSPGADRSSTST